LTFLACARNEVWDPCGIEQINTCGNGGIDTYVKNPNFQFLKISVNKPNAFVKPDTFAKMEHALPRTPLALTKAARQTKNAAQDMSQLATAPIPFNNM